MDGDNGDDANKSATETKSGDEDDDAATLFVSTLLERLLVDVLCADHEASSGALPDNAGYSDVEVKRAVKYDLQIESAGSALLARRLRARTAGMRE